MLVRDRMTSKVITMQPKTSIYDALALMKENHIRRLPGLKGKKLIGIVTWTDLMRALPSPATTLSIWEIPSLLTKTPVAEVMTSDPITLPPTAALEEAAVLMRQHKIGGLPVMDQGKLIGIITESDLFDAFIDLLGLTRGGARLTIDLEERAGRLEEILRPIDDCQVPIRSLPTQSRRQPGGGSSGGCVSAGGH